MNHHHEVKHLMAERFSRVSLISVATTHGEPPYTRTVNGYYEDGAFYHNQRVTAA